MGADNLKWLGCWALWRVRDLSNVVPDIYARTRLYLKLPFLSSATYLWVEAGNLSISWTYPSWPLEPSFSVVQPSYFLNIICGTRYHKNALHTSSQCNLVEFVLDLTRLFRQSDRVWFSSSIWLFWSQSKTLLSHFGPCFLSCLGWFVFRSAALEGGYSV